MSSVKEIAMKMDKIKKREENKKCFDCGEKGTTYVCTDFGTFICSRCAGILRELNFKVKGISVSIFNQKEIDLLEKNGNEVAYGIWMAKYKEGKDKKPNNKNDDELREFLKKKYKDKKWMKKTKKGSDSEDEDDDDNKKKGKKKDNKKKKDKDNDDEESESDESDSDDDKKNKKNKKKKEKVINKKIDKKLMNDKKNNSILDIQDNLINELQPEGFYEMLRNLFNENNEKIVDKLLKIYNFLIEKDKYQKEVNLNILNLLNKIKNLLEERFDLKIKKEII